MDVPTLVDNGIEHPEIVNAFMCCYHNFLEFQKFIQEYKRNVYKW